MTQETRNKIYAAAATVGTLAVILGLITQEDADQAVSLVNELLTVGGTVVTLAGTILAFVKSLPSKVTTVEVPKKLVTSVNLTTGNTRPVK